MSETTPPTEGSQAQPPPPAAATATAAPRPAAPARPAVPAARPAPTSLKKDADSSIPSFPALVYREFIASLVVGVILTVIALVVQSPLQQQADPSMTPNPSKAPWYFLGLQELLTMFHPMVAGVTIPGIGLGLLAVAPYVDKNPSHFPKDRKFAIAIFTIFIMLWAVLVIIGSFFRGEGFNFVFPWNNGIFFEL